MSLTFVPPTTTKLWHPSMMDVTLWEPWNPASSTKGRKRGLPSLCTGWSADGPQSWLWTLWWPFSWLQSWSLWRTLTSAVTPSRDSFCESPGFQKRNEIPALHWNEKYKFGHVGVPARRTICLYSHHSSPKVTQLTQENLAWPVISSPGKGRVDEWAPSFPTVQDAAKRLVSLLPHTEC